MTNEMSFSDDGLTSEELIDNYGTDDLGQIADIIDSDDGYDIYTDIDFDN